MRVSPSGHLRHHWRFYASLALGFLLWLAVARLAPALRLVAAGDGFFIAYLLFAAWMIARRSSPEHLRRRASSEDEGITVIVLITAIAIVVSFYSIFAILDETAPGVLHLALAIVGVPLGWLTLHTVMAYHYAHLYYTGAKVKGGGRRDVGGLVFPGDEAPSAADFLYYSFVVGMTAQVSDVQVAAPGMRRVTLVHGVASFFFNTVILALAVNIAAGLTH
jgi:uncharacterized membrane protein